MILGYPDLVFLDLNEGKEYHYHPKEDITPYEVAQLLELFVYGAIYQKERPVEWKLFITKKNLLRHFEDRIIGS